MSARAGAPVAVVDYGLGNLFSVLQACARVGLPAEVTARPADLARAPGIILPGVGAFPSAMATLRERGLDQALAQAVADGRPLLGVCLGLQLLMDSSEEFGTTRGLGVVAGDVRRLQGHRADGSPLRVPHIGWSPVRQARPGAWRGTLLEGVPDGARMYFVHSYGAHPADPAACLASTPFESATVCSAARAGSATAVQFHPERSGEAGLLIYRNFRSMLEGA